MAACCWSFERKRTKSATDLQQQNLPSPPHDEASERDGYASYKPNCADLLQVLAQVASCGAYTQLWESCSLLASYGRLDLVCAIGFSPCGTTHTCLASSGKASHTSHLGGKPGVPQPLTSRIVRELLASQKRWVITGPQPDVHKAHTTPVMQSYFLAPLQCNQTVAGLLILGHSKPMFFEDSSWEMAGEVAATWLSRLFLDGQLTSYCAIQQCISSCNSLSDLAKAVSWTVMQQQLQALHQSPLQCRIAFIRNDAASALLFDNLWHQGPEPDASRSRKSSYTQGDATRGPWHSSSLSASGPWTSSITHLASLSSNPATELAGSSAAQNSTIQPLSTRPTHPRILGLVQRPAQPCSQQQPWGPSAPGAADHRSTARQPGSLAGPSALGPLGLITVPTHSMRNSPQQATSPSATLTGSTTTFQPHPSVPKGPPASLLQPVADRDPLTVTPTSLLSEAQGTCVPLTNTVLGEALKAKQAVWVSDCTAFMQNSCNPHQDVYLATSQEAAGCMVVCPMYHQDRPFMALYLNMSQRYSTQVLETVGQALLETCAVMEPAIWHLLHGELDFEWRYLQTQVLGGPGSSSELQAGERILLSAFSSAARSRASPCLLRPPSTAQETPRLGWAGLGKRVSVKVWDMEDDENMSPACERGAAACTAPMPAAAAAAAAVVSVSTVVAAALGRIAKADDTAPRVSSSVLMQCWEQELPSLAGANKISSLSEMAAFPDNPNAIPAVPDVVGSSHLALATMPASTMASTMASPMPKPSPGAQQALPSTTGAREPQSALATESLLTAAHSPESASGVGPAATSHLSTSLSSCAPPSSQPTRSSQPQLHSLGQFMLKGLAPSGAPSSLPSPGASLKVPVLQQCLRDHSPDSRSASRRHSPQLLASSSQATLSPTQSFPVPSPHPLTQVQGSGVGTQDAEAGRQEGQRRGPALRATLLGRELKVALLGLLNWDIGNKRRALPGARPAPSPEQGTLVGRTVSCTVGPGGAGEGGRRAARRWLPKPGDQSGAVSPQEGSFTDLTRSCADMNEFLPRYNSVSVANPASPTPTPDRYGKPALLPLARPGSHHLQVPSWPSSPRPGVSSSMPRLVIPCPLASVLNQAGPPRPSQEGPGSTKDAAEEGPCDSQTTRPLGGSNRTPGKQRHPSFRVNRSPMASSSARRIGALISGLQGKVQEAQRHQLQARAESLHQDELGNISISAKIGAGGFGACYRGLYQGTEAAIKVVHDRHGSATEAFRNAVELAVLSTLSHPNIVQVLTYFTDVGVSYPSADDLMSGARDPLTLHPAEQLAAYEAFLEHQQEEQQRQRQQEQQQEQQQGPEGQQQQLQQLPTAQYQLPHNMLMPSDQGLSSQCPSPHAPPAPTLPAPAQRIKRALVICMEYCDMGTLCDAVQQGAFHDYTAATPEAAPRWPAIYQTLLELALALRYLHSLSLVHRDVKLQNVLLKSHSNDPRGFTCKLSDFGLVKLISDKQHSCVSSSSSVSQLSNLQPDGSHGLLPAITFKPWSEVFANPGPEGTQQNNKAPQASPQGAAPAPVPATFHVGSPKPRRRYSGTVTHLPPEAFASGCAVESSMDVWAFGVCMWELATGRAVYGALMSDAIIRQVTDHGMRPMFDNNTPQEYRQLATRCWDSNPSARPTAEELVQSLSAALGSLRGGRRPSHLPSRLHIPSPPCATGTDLPAGREVQPTSPGYPSPVTSPTTQLLQACRAAAPLPAVLPKGPGMAAQRSTELPAQGRDAQARQHDGLWAGQARRGREVTFKDIEEQDLRYRPSSAQVGSHHEDKQEAAARQRDQQGHTRLAAGAAPWDPNQPTTSAMQPPMPDGSLVGLPGITLDQVVGPASWWEGWDQGSSVRPRGAPQVAQTGKCDGDFLLHIM